jgi:alpha-L-rhamnosidase
MFAHGYRFSVVWLLVGLFLPFALAAATAIPPPLVVSLAGEWAFQLDPGEKGANERWYMTKLRERIGLPGSTAYVGAAWYQREVEIPESWRGKRVLLLLERTQAATVWVDEIEVDSQDGSSSSVAFDLTADIKPGHQRITLCIDNRRTQGAAATAETGAQPPGKLNGIFGRIELRASEPGSPDELKPLAAPGSAAGRPPGPPSNLRVNDLVNPVGTGADIAFGWHVIDPDPNEIQTRYQILVASSADRLAPGRADVWDSGAVERRAQSHVPFGGEPLQSNRRYHWAVRTWDKDGQVGDFSAPATFDIGLLANGDWDGAAWIRRESKDADDYTFYRKQATLPAKPILRAVAYLSATHKYALHVNGVPAGKGPAYQHPQYQYYNAHDITALLRGGVENQFAVFTHWFGGGQGRPAGERGLIAKIVVEHADGETSVIGTDGTWRQARAEAWVLDDLVHRNRGEGVGYVERIDGRKLLPNWTALDFDDSAWAAATVVGPQPSAPWTGGLSPDLTRIEERVISPVEIKRLGEGKYLVDLGRTYAGMPRLRFSGGAPGTVVSMRGADLVGESGEIAKDAKSQSTLMEYRAILDGGAFVFEPVEYLGMRYFQIDNAPMPVTPENFSFVVRHGRLDASASAFASSDSTLNSVWELMKHSIFTCAQEEFVDTPTREKGGFLLDGAVQSTVAMPVLNERALTRRTLGEFLRSMEQHWSKPGDRGRINAVYPNKDGGRDIPDFTQAFLVWAWTYYRETGDRAFLRANYGKLKDVADYVARHIDPATGLVTDLTGGSGAYKSGIVDWPASMRFGYDMNTAVRTVINGWAYADFDLISRIAGELGESADRDTYRARAEALKTAINTRLLGADGVYVDGLSSEGLPSANASQHANMFPLALGIVPEERRAAVIELVKRKGMSVGMVTVSWLVRALGESEQGEALLDLFTNADRPGWARSLVRGATATWESWDADVAGESLSHAWGAAGLEGYVRYVLGIRPQVPQYEQVLIKPLDFGEKLKWARGHIATDRGAIAVEWKHTEERYELRVVVPVNVTAEIQLPAGTSSATPSVKLNGATVAFAKRGDRLIISALGSGEHVLVREDAAAPL